jgi:hypothetical protein
MENWLHGGDSLIWLNVALQYRLSLRYQHNCGGIQTAACISSYNIPLIFPLQLSRLQLNPPGRSAF